MFERDRSVATGIFVLLALSWLGFLVHRSSAFAGSLAGGIVGVAAAAFMLVPLAYVLVKRNERMRRAWSAEGGLARLLALHVYSGLVAALLAVVHSGHKFYSFLGISLTTSLLLSVLTGYVVRYYMRSVAESLGEKTRELETIRSALDDRAAAIPAPRVIETGAANIELLALASAAADLQQSIQFQERIRRQFRGWLAAHIVASIAAWLLLTLHIWAGIYFGLRWFR